MTNAAKERRKKHVVGSMAPQRSAERNYDVLVSELSRGLYEAQKSVLITYKKSEGVWGFVAKIREATPMQLVEVERRGVSGVFLKDIARQINIPAWRFYEIVGVPKATAERKAAENAAITGAGGQAAIGMARLLAIARGIVDNSTSPQAKGFDAAKWLGQWIELPQPALGGRKPADLLDTPTGINVVARVLGAIESGAYV